MNSVLNKFTRGKGLKNLAISIVILFEILAITIVSVFAWVETVSSIKIAGDGLIDTYVFTDAEIGAGTGTIDMAGYFKQSGDMHFAPASSADGKTMYFPQANVASTNTYRKGNSSDKNTNYLSVTFRVKTSIKADFFFTEVPKFSALGEDIRVSITSRAEGSNAAPVTKIYALSSSSNNVVNSTSGNTTAKANVDAFKNHVKDESGSTALFTVDADETKIVTINIWLQKKSTDMNNVMSQDITITNLGIVSSLSPRHVTLVPTNIWNGNNPVYYAWCWEGNSKSPQKLFKLTDNGDGSYSFDYDGSYQKICFIRAKTGCKAETGGDFDWNNDKLHQTEDLKIPDSPANPTYFVTSLTGGTDGKSSGIWEVPATVKVDYVTSHEAFGTLSAAYSNYTATGDGQKAQILCRGSSSVKITATPKTNYEFDGWYSDVAGTTKATPTAASANVTAPTKGNEITYYAKFKEVVTITIKNVVDKIDGSTTAAGTIKIDSKLGSATDSASGAGKTVSMQVEKGATVTLSATANAGYTFDGIYTTSTGNTEAPSSFVANSSETYYARFTTKSYDVTAHACYSADGSSYTTDNSTGGTVQAGSSSAGTTSIASVKYNTSVTLKATTNNGYEFVGWYNSSGGQLSTSASYSYKLTTDANVDVYARFKKVTVKYTINLTADTATTYGSMTDPKNYVGFSSSPAAKTASTTVSGGSSVTVYAKATNSYYQFDGWYNGSARVSTSTSYTFTPTSDMNLTAKFTQKTRTIYFENASSWSGTVYCYAWENSSGDNNAAWRGVAMTDTGKYQNGKKVYSYILWTKFDKVKFNTSNGNQTGDLTVPSSDNTYHNYGDGGWYSGTW